MDYGYIFNKSNYSSFSDLHDILHGFNIGDCVQVRTKVLRNTKFFVLDFVGCIMDIQILNNGFIHIFIKECDTNITFILNDVKDIKRVECNKC